MAENILDPNKANQEGAKIDTSRKLRIGFIGTGHNQYGSCRLQFTDESGSACNIREGRLHQCNLRKPGKTEYRRKQQRKDLLYGRCSALPR